MSLNINRNVDDVFYRYKMPKLIAKVEGKGNGIKTVIVNMPEISKALNRPPTYPTKYFGCELGAQIQIDNKNERYIVNGEHDASKLQSLLDGFIKKFVLCPECDNPETTLAVRKMQIFQACKACGFSGQIDSRHKLTTYIIKAPPTGEENGESPAVVKTRSGKKEKESAKKREAGHSPTTVEKDEKDEEESTPPMENSQNGSEGDDDDWAVDSDTAKIELTNGMSALTMNDDLEKSVEERLDMFERFLEKQKKAAGKNKLDARAILNEAMRLDVKEKAVLVISRSIFDENVLQEVAANANLLLNFTNENKRAQKYLLGGLEQLVVAHKEKLLPKVAHVLKAVYDADILTEENILEWASKPSKKYVSKEENREIIAKAEPFLKWLREAESESDEEDEDDVEIVYTDGKNKPKPAVASAQEEKKSVVNGESKKSAEEDLNIDDI